MELRVWGLGLIGRMGCETVSVVWFPFSGNGDVGYHGNLALLLQPLLLRRPLTYTIPSRSRSRGSGHEGEANVNHLPRHLGCC